MMCGNVTGLQGRCMAYFGQYNNEIKVQENLEEMK